MRCIETFRGFIRPRDLKTGCLKIPHRTIIAPKIFESIRRTDDPKLSTKNAAEIFYRIEALHSTLASGAREAVPV